MKVVSTGGLNWIVESGTTSITINSNMCSFIGSSTDCLFNYSEEAQLLEYDYSKIDAVVQLSDQFQYVNPFWIDKMRHCKCYTSNLTTCLDGLRDVVRINYDESIKVGSLRIQLTHGDPGDQFWDNAGSGCIVEDVTTGAKIYFQGTAGVPKKLVKMSGFDAIYFTFNAYSTTAASSAYFNYYDSDEYYNKRDDSLLLLDICKLLPPARAYYICGSDIQSCSGNMYRSNNIEYAKFLNPYMLGCSVSAMSFGDCVDVITEKRTQKGVLVCSPKKYSIDETQVQDNHHEAIEMVKFLERYSSMILLTNFGRNVFGLGKFGDVPLSESRYVFALSGCPEKNKRDRIYEFNMSINKFVLIDRDIEISDLSVDYPYGFIVDYNSWYNVLTGKKQLWEVANSDLCAQWYLDTPKTAPVTSLFILFQEACNIGITTRNYKKRRSVMEEMLTEAV